MRQSLGTAVFAGMLGVTLFGLLFTPTFYVVVRGAAARLVRFRKGNRPPDAMDAAVAKKDGSRAADELTEDQSAS